MLSQGHSMMLVYFLQLAAGGAASLLLTPAVEKVGTNFYRMMSSIFALIAAVATAMAANVTRRSLAGSKLWISSNLAKLGFPLPLWVFGGLFVLVAALWLVQSRPLRSWVWGILTGLGTIALLDLVPWFVPSDAPPALFWLQVASMLLSAVSLGGVVSALLLGHWYLVTPSLSVRHLQRLVLLYAVALLAQAVCLVGGLFIVSHGADAELVQLVVARPGFDALCFWVRVLVGIVGGVVLAWMTWQTLSKYHQTQAATGILYVAAIVVLIGEACGRYLLAFLKLPL